MDSELQAPATRRGFCLRDRSEANFEISRCQAAYLRHSVARVPISGLPEIE
jgi:hypothetical protein